MTDWINLILKSLSNMGHVLQSVAVLLVGAAFYFGGNDQRISDNANLRHKVDRHGVQIAKLETEFRNVDRRLGNINDTVNKILEKVRQ